MARLGFVLLLLIFADRSGATEWIWLVPNGCYSRDLSMGASTIALNYPAQSASINPAGLELAPAGTSRIPRITWNIGGGWKLSQYFDGEAADKPIAEEIGESARLLVRSVGVRSGPFSVALMLNEPAMLSSDTLPYQEYESTSGLTSHQNGIQFSLHLHPRVSLGGKIDRYYHYSRALDEGYGYGLILRPKAVNIGFHYQRFPVSGARVAHPLDRRRDETTTAGLGWSRGGWTATFQLQNVSQNDESAFLEPHAGVEWRVARAIAVRAGGAQFSRSQRWAWTAGVGIIDMNWLREPNSRLTVADEMLQLAVGVVYNRYKPELGIGSLVFVWHW